MTFAKTFCVIAAAALFPVAASSNVMQTAPQLGNEATTAGTASSTDWIVENNRRLTRGLEQLTLTLNRTAGSPLDIGQELCASLYQSAFFIKDRLTIADRFYQLNNANNAESHDYRAALDARTQNLNEAYEQITTLCRRTQFSVY